MHHEFLGVPLLPFASLISEGGLPAGQFLLHTALVRTLTQAWGAIDNEPPMHQLLQYLHVMGEGTHVVHWLYQALLTHTTKPLQRLRDTWAEHRNRPWTDKEWNQIQAGATHIPRNARFKLIQTYIIHRPYLSPDKINKYFKITTSNCPRCRLTDADLLHMLWSCPTLSHYWCRITETLSRCTGVDLPNTWEICILGLYKRTRTNRTGCRFRDLGLIVAKRLITKRWKQRDPPEALHWELSMEVWAQAESTSLHREETAGLRKYPIAQAWDAMLRLLRATRAVTPPTPANT